MALDTLTILSFPPGFPAKPQILSFRPEPDPERSRRERRSGGTCCLPAPLLTTGKGATSVVPI